MDKSEQSGKYYVVYLDENAIDSPPFETEAEAEKFLHSDSDYLQSNGEPLESFAVQFIRDDELSDVEV